MADFLNEWGEFPVDDEPQPWERTVGDTHKISGRTASSRPVVRSDGKRYASIVLAAADNGLHVSTIRRSCNGRDGKTAAGYGWRWAR